MSLRHEADKSPDNILGRYKWANQTCFSQNGTYNWQSTKYWALENPIYFTDVRRQLRFAINICCAIKNNKLIDSKFSDGTLASARYLIMLQNVIPDFVEISRCSIIRIYSFNMIAFLLAYISSEGIGYGGFEDWPPRLLDLTPLDFFVRNIK